MYIIEIFIRAASAVVLRADEIRTFQNFDAAETAGTAATGRMDLQSRAFQSDRERFGSFGRDNRLGHPDADGEIIDLVFLLFREALKTGDVPDLAEYFKADALLRDSLEVPCLPKRTFTDREIGLFRQFMEQQGESADAWFDIVAENRTDAPDGE